MNDYINKHLASTKLLIAELCKIPSPTGNEQKKALFIWNKLKGYGADSAYIDDCGNVLYYHGLDNQEPVTLFTAHIDTVFEQISVINPVYENGKMIAPSVGDNCANVAGLMKVIEILFTISPKLQWQKNILFAFNVGEEGLGNLKGIKHIMKEWNGKIDEVIAVDGQYKRVVNKAVGSKRIEVELLTQGGHSWGKFGLTNAIAIAANIIQQIYTIKVPMEPKTTYNVGLITGGTSVNTIAGMVRFSIDMRSLDERSLGLLEEQISDIIKKNTPKDTRLKVTVLGDRPCSQIQDLSSLEAKISSIRRKYGLETPFMALSTDANIPFSQRIPALAFGVYLGDGAHTADEYIELDSLHIGLSILLSFVLSYASE
jgi:tripeptide aminopeptidase